MTLNNNAYIQGPLRDLGGQVWNIMGEGMYALPSRPDNYDQIMRAIDRADAAGGGIVLVPPHRFKLLSPLDMSSLVSLVGVGSGASVLFTTADIPLIKRSGTGSALETLAIEGLMLEGPGSGSSTNAGISLYEAAYWKLRNLRITGFNSGVKVDANNYADSIGGYYNECENLRIHACTTGYSIVNGANEVHVRGGHVNNCATGIAIGKSGSIACDNVSFVQVAVENATKGIDLGLTQLTSFFGCRFEAAGVLTINAGATETNLLGCHITNGTTVSDAGARTLIFPDESLGTHALRVGNNYHLAFMNAAGTGASYINQSTGNNWQFLSDTGSIQLLAATDTILYGNAGAAEALRAKSNGSVRMVMGASDHKLVVGTDGSITVGDGTGAPDTKLPYRSASGVIKTDNEIQFPNAVVLGFVNAAGTDRSSIRQTALDNLQVASVTGSLQLQGATNAILYGGGGTEGLRVQSDGSVQIGAGTAIKKHLSGTATWDPANLADGATATTTVPVTGAVVGDTVAVGFASITTAGWSISGQVTAADTVGVTLTNHTGGAVDLASGALRADVWRH